MWKGALKETMQFAVAMGTVGWLEGGAVVSKSVLSSSEQEQE